MSFRIHTFAKEGIRGLRDAEVSRVSLCRDDVKGIMKYVLSSSWSVGHFVYRGVKFRSGKIQVHLDGHVDVHAVEEGLGKSLDDASYGALCAGLVYETYRKERSS